MFADIKAAIARARAALRRRGASSQDADDLAQDAWLRMECSLKGEAVSNPEAYLIRTAINLSIDAHRAKSVRGEEVAVDDVALVDVAPGVEALLLGRERLARVTVGLERLPERTREIFLAHRLDGRTYTDIARELGVSINAVEKHVTKATLLLTSWMEGW
jgi:RNA polymerase sigma factor (sigma-70 family)